MKAERFSKNPLISPAMVKVSRADGEVMCAFNPGAAEHNGEVLLLLRVAERPIQEEGFVSTWYIDSNKSDTELSELKVPLDDADLEYTDPRYFMYQDTLYLTSISHLRLAHSKDGENFTIEESPALMPCGFEEEYGCEDPRVTQIDGTFYINYSAISLTSSICTKMVTTKDWKVFHRQGVIFCPDNKDVAIFPQKVNGLYAALHRPSPKQLGTPNMWISYSPDLKHWGGHKFLMGTREGMWDNARIGCGHHPFLTEEGWLEIYHGADTSGTYCLGAVLMDKNNPSIVLARSGQPIAAPTEPYEVDGVVEKILFNNGTILRGDELLVYYGAADTVSCGMRMSLSEILGSLR